MTDTVERIVIEGEGITVPLLVWRRFKRPMPGIVEQVFEMNQNLADLGLFLPVGTEVLMPIPTPRPAPIVEPVRLWGD
ncbi:tail protein X [Pararhizobium haloflavum]|uniref:tail protein X n=1 Tax=Pararhizobium haloflavum TaxID=2037914 RepID=UPI000C17FA02|nr:tail protein X [Pararhizobium haloflavum]